MTRRPSLPEIRACVEVYHGMNPGDSWALWCGELDRTWRCVWARRQTIHLAREMTSYSLVEMRRHFTSHKTTHSTMVDGERMSREREQTDSRYAGELEDIRAMLHQICETPRTRAEAERTGVVR